MPRSTYTPGYNLRTTQPLTKQKLVQLCHALAQAFNTYYQTDEFSFEPEPITEGGIVFTNYKSVYKTMRIFPTKKFSLYGWLPSNVMQAWQNDTEVLLEAQSEMGTYLKSFHGAPLWTHEDLKLFEQCFNEFGIQVSGKYPTKKSLVTTTRICGDPRF